MNIWIYFSWWFFIFVPFHTPYILFSKKINAHLFANFRKIFGQFTKKKYRNLNLGFFLSPVCFINRLDLFFVQTVVIGHECNFVFCCKCELWKYHIFNATGDDMTLKMQRGHFDSFSNLFLSAKWWPYEILRTRTNNNKLPSLEGN